MSASMRGTSLSSKMSFFASRTYSRRTSNWSRPTSWIFSTSSSMKSKASRSSHSVSSFSDGISISVYLLALLTDSAAISSFSLHCLLMKARICETVILFEGMIESSSIISRAISAASSFFPLIPWLNFFVTNAFASRLYFFTAFRTFRAHPSSRIASGSDLTA